MPQQKQSPSSPAHAPAARPMARWAVLAAFPAFPGCPAFAAFAALALIPPLALAQSSTGPYVEGPATPPGVQVQAVPSPPIPSPASDPAPSAPPSAPPSTPPYPPPTEGQARFLAQLPQQPGEDRLRVEIVVGKTLAVDCNRFGFSGALEQRVVEGWGAPYYVLPRAQGPFSTRMACPGHGAPAARWVPVILNEAPTVPYNSRMPLAVYVPEGFTVQYRIWRGDEQLHELTPR